MALENDIKDLTAALRELTVVIQAVASNPPQGAADQPTETSKPKVKKEAAKPTAEPDPEPDTSDTDLLGGGDDPDLDPEVFMQDKLLPAFKKLLNAQGGQAKAKAILTKYDAANLGKLPKDIDVYNKVMSDTEEALNG